MSESAGRRRRETAGTLTSVVTRVTSGVPAPYASWSGAVWTIVVALDFYWLSNPLVFSTFDESLRNACVATGVGLLLTLPWFQLPRPSWSVGAVLAFGYASALWSTNAALTVGFTTVYLVIAVLATLIIANADARTIAQGVALGGVLVLALSFYALYSDLPGSHVPVGNTGYLAGVGTNRNILAYTLVLALAFALAFLPRRWWARAIWAVGSGVLLTGTCLTQSGTGMAAAIVLVVAAAVLALSDRRLSAGVVHSARRRWSVRALAMLILVCGALGLELLSRALGRDFATLSGRLPLWEATWSATTGVDRWIGAGWGAVWPHPWHPAGTNADYTHIIELSGFPLAHGHSSLFDLIPEVGVVGVAVYALTYVQAVYRALGSRGPRRSPTPSRLAASRTVLLGVLALVLFGLTEPMSTVPLGWFAIAMLATGPVPARELPRGRRAARRVRDRRPVRPASRDTPVHSGSG